MHAAQLTRLKAWFDTYTQNYLTGDPAADGPLELKIDHTHRVLENARRIAGSLFDSIDLLNLAEAVGLLHDTGRFEQYRRFATFNDRQSVNHGALGVEVLETEGLLTPLPESERTIIIDAVRFHNAPALPTTRRFDASMPFMRLVRDADKLDIWRVFADYFRQAEHPVAAIVQHLPDQPTWSPSIVAAILAGDMARFGDMRSLNDFKLLQLSWVFDLHFAETAKMARERDDVDVIAASLPDDDELDLAIEKVMVRLTELAAVVDPIDKAG